MVKLDNYYGQLCDVQSAVDDYQKQMIFAKPDKKYDILRETYAFYKQAAFDLEKAGANLVYMAPISAHIHMMAEFLPTESIIDIKPYDFTNERKVTSIFDIEQILDALVYEERCRLFENAKKYGVRDFSEYDPINDCRLSALSIYNMAKNIGLDTKVKIIEPGYLYESPLYEGGCKHVVALIYFMGKVYLVDPTYSQFFMTKRCVLDKIGAVYLSNPNPGTFMVMNESRRETAEKVLNNGWIELTAEDMKNYFDGFTMFYRNGSYYENTADFSYETPYTYEDYYQFLEGFDNQVRHEGLENLGYQTRALKDPKMNFNKR